MKEEIKEITNKMIKTSQPNGVFLTAKTRDKIIYYINNSLEEIERLKSIIKEDKKIEKVNTYVLCDYDFKSKDDDNNLIATNIIDRAFEEYSHKINEIIDKLNEMEKE